MVRSARKVCVILVFKIIYRQCSSKASLTSFHLVEEWWQAGAQLDHQVPPDLHFSKHQSLCPDIYGCEGLHEEFHPFATAKYLFIETIMTTILVKCSQTAEQQGLTGIENRTWIESKVIYKALPSNEGNLLDGRRRAAEAKFLQMQQRVNEGASFMQQLCGIWIT